MIGVSFFCNGKMDVLSFAITLLVSFAVCKLSAADLFFCSAFCFAFLVEKEVGLLFFLKRLSLLFICACNLPPASTVINIMVIKGAAAEKYFSLTLQKFIIAVAANVNILAATCCE